MTTTPPASLIVLTVAAFLSALLLRWAATSSCRAPRRADRWAMLEDVLGLFFVVGMTYAAMLQVIVRYAASAHLSLPWTEELSRLLLIWTTLWGAAALQRRDDHISMTVVFDRFPPRVQRGLRVLGDLVVVLALFPVVWHGWQSAYLLREMLTIALGVPMSAFVMAVPVSGTLMIFHTLVLVIRRLHGDAGGPVDRDLPA